MNNRFAKSAVLRLLLSCNIIRELRHIAVGRFIIRSIYTYDAYDELYLGNVISINDAKMKRVISIKSTCINL